MLSKVWTAQGKYYGEKKTFEDIVATLKKY